ncbi:MAG TPA: rhomboid family intramembrane serine protease [Candidatus Limnocylindria bacterium]|nr:rhomboid family intramembrane serine protease [Candidatus Limnocylindria bacterium]
MTSVEMPAEPLFECIGARNERQAMDWCLVLASQGIEVTPDRDPETGRWRLQVPLPLGSSARSAIAKFQEENQRFDWRQEIYGSGLTLHWAGLAWPLVLLVFFLTQDRTFDTAVFNTTAFRHGEWWRPVSAVFIHSDLGHLAANATFGALTVGLAMALGGVWTTFLLTLLSGVAGNFFALAFRGHEYIGLGASGAVMGALGLAAAGSFHAMKGFRFARRPVLVIVGSAFLLFSLFGLDARSDILAHVGGFLAGLALGWISFAAGLQRYQGSCAFVLSVIMGVVWFTVARHM